MISHQELEELIRQGIPDATIDLRDTVGDGDHWLAVVVSPSFEGKSLVQQHQLVYRALGDAMHSRVHALELKTYTPNRARELGLFEE